MTIKLLVAPPASGKTAACIERILAIHKDQPLAQVWVLVPNSQKAAYFKARLAVAGGGMGVKVGEFRHLYKELFEENGVFRHHFVSAFAPPYTGGCSRNLWFW